ncbi:hypothetical protein J3F83DRAFT_738986 [Trichoderma novae-zelandiae]
MGTARLWILFGIYEALDQMHLAPIQLEVTALVLVVPRVSASIDIGSWYFVGVSPLKRYSLTTQISNALSPHQGEPGSSISFIEWQRSLNSMFLLLFLLSFGKRKKKLKFRSFSLPPSVRSKRPLSAGNGIGELPCNNIRAVRRAALLVSASSTWTLVRLVQWSPPDDAEQR